MRGHSFICSRRHDTAGRGWTVKEELKYIVQGSDHCLCPGGSRVCRGSSSRGSVGHSVPPRAPTIPCLSLCRDRWTEEPQPHREPTPPERPAWVVEPPGRSRAACAEDYAATCQAPGWGRPCLRPPGSARVRLALPTQDCGDFTAPARLQLWVSCFSPRLFQVQLDLGSRLFQIQLGDSSSLVGALVCLQVQLMDGSSLFQLWFKFCLQLIHRSHLFLLWFVSWTAPSSFLVQLFWLQFISSLSAACVQFQFISAPACFGSSCSAAPVHFCFFKRSWLLTRL